MIYLYYKTHTMSRSSQCPYNYKVRICTLSNNSDRIIYVY